MEKSRDCCMLLASDYLTRVRIVKGRFARKDRLQHSATWHHGAANHSKECYARTNVLHEL